jgi:NAD(P)-dependent dehydrogenase (short-subunit alcohol dehydrogenase family)
MIERKTFENATEDYHDKVFATNVRSIFFVTQAALPYEGLTGKEMRND